MRRLLYLTTLLVLQFALVVDLAGPLAHALRIHTAPGHAPAGWPALLQLVATAAAVAGASLALALPGVALSRHRREGTSRFRGLPACAVALALSGAAILAAGAITLACVPMLPADVRMTTVLIARPVIAGGLALATAGVLSAEILHRNAAATPGLGPGTSKIAAHRGHAAAS